MDNSDLPLVVAEMLIEIQQLKGQVARMESAFFEVRDDLSAIRSDVHATHLEVLGQSGRLSLVLTKVQAVLREQARLPTQGLSAAAPGSEPTSTPD